MRWDFRLQSRHASPPRSGRQEVLLRRQGFVRAKTSLFNSLFVFLHVLHTIYKLLHCAVMDLCWRVRLPGVAQLAVLDRPGDITIMTGTTVLAIYDLHHVDFIATGFERESQVAVANLAAKTNTMKPVRENDRSHAGIIGEFIDDDIP